MIDNREFTKQVFKAIKSGNIDQIKELLNEGDFKKYEPYFINIAVKSKNFDVVKCVIETLKPDAIPNTILNTAILHKSNSTPKIIKKLIPLVKPKKLITLSLYLAVEEGNKNIIDLLFDVDLYSEVKAIADYNGIDGDGVNYLMQKFSAVKTKEMLKESIPTQSKVSKPSKIARKI